MKFKLKTVKTAITLILMAALIFCAMTGCSGKNKDKTITDEAGSDTETGTDSAENSNQTENSSDLNSDNSDTGNSGDGSNTDPDDGTDSKPVSITVTAAGDCTIGINYKMSYDNSFDQVYDKNGASYFFKNVYDILSKDDFSIVNLEGPLTTSNEVQSKIYNHRGKPEYVGVLKAGSVEAVSLSNNHTYDFGQSGADETVNVVSKAGLAYACDGTYGVYETKGIKIGFVSVNEHYDGQLVEAWLEDGIKKLRSQGADIVIACIHWGRSEDEYTSHIDDYQTELGRKCIDWGYDLVIGNHVHVLEGINKYKGKYITNSLGNFCFGGSKNQDDKDCGIFQQTFTFVNGELQSDDNVRFIPCSMSSVSWINNYQPTVATGTEAKRIIDKINTYSAQYGVTFDSEGRAISASLTEQNKADAYFSIFKASLEKNKTSVKQFGIDISALGLSDTTYLKGLFDSWCSSKGITAFYGTKSELVDAGYNKKAANREAVIIIFDAPVWSNLQVQCTIMRNITLLNYLRESYVSAFAGGTWVTQSGTYIQK